MWDEQIRKPFPCGMLGGSSTSPPPPSTSPRAPHTAARFLPGQPDGPPVYPPPPPGARPRSQEFPPQAVQHRVVAHVFGVDVAPHPQGVAVVEPGLSAALGAPHQEIAAPVARQGIGEVGSSSARGRSMKKPSSSIFCNRGASAGRTHTCFMRSRVPPASGKAKVLVWSGPGLPLLCPVCSLQGQDAPGSAVLPSTAWCPGRPGFFL